jgi:alditol oxidase
MNKRNFLKLLSATMATPVVARVLNAMPQEKLKNWSGNFEFSTDRIATANSIEQARGFVTQQSKLKALGTRHCFNRIADSKDNLLSMRALDQFVEVDAGAKTVTVDAGITYGKLAPILDAKGLALHNLASLPHISVAGSCSTGTHGSGEKNGNLSTAVSGLEFITASGDTVKLSRAKDGDAFHGAVVGLGALGVITRLTLDVQPKFTMRQYVYENLPLDQLNNHFDAIESAAYSVSLFTDWQKKRFSEVWLKTRTGSGKPFDPQPEFFGATAAKKNLHPIVELSAENCTEQLGIPGPWYERLPHFRMGFTPSAGKELQSEFFVPRSNAIDAILAVERLRDQITPHLLITEIRTIAADNLWMSPAYQRDSVALHFTWKQDWPAVSAVLPVIEKELSPFNARPHWGKLFTMSPAVLKSRYPRLAAFINLVKQYDPQGKFRNDFLDRNVFNA